MRWLGAFLVFLLAASTSGAQDFGFGAPFRTLGSKKHTRARMVLSHEAARPGDTVLAGIELKMDPGWHTYWMNPGQSGQATEIHWNLPPTVSAEEIRWPVPEKFVSPDELKLTTYVYHDRAVLLVPLQVSPNAEPGERDLAALVKWLECEIACIPGSNMVRATLMVTNETRLAADTNFFAEAQQRLPSTNVPGSVTAAWENSSTTNRSLAIEWTAEAAQPDFFPYENALASISPKTAAVTNAGKVVLRKNVERTGEQWPAEVKGLLVRQEGEHLAGYEVTLPLQTTSATAAPAVGGVPTKSFLVWLIYAFLGGLVLNVMPCVLPVIALKILGFVNQSREHPARVRALGVLYTLGVLASFLVLAGVIVALKTAGQQVGWGMQFSNPVFVVALTVIVTLVALNLFGLFEITLAAGAMNVAGAAASKHGSAGAFMNGVLATALATPCLAPFLGGAVGFALVQPSHVIILFFVAIGFGLAVPYLVLSWFPQFVRFLPKPGAWMERFKVAMGFPMLATAVWLWSLTTTFYGERAWWLAEFLVVLTIAAWVFGTFVQRGRSRRGFAAALALAILALGYWWTLEEKLRWRVVQVDAKAGSTLALAPKGYDWEPWSPEAVAAARAQGLPVVVDFTAKWCLTCNVSVKPAFEDKRVIEAMRASKTKALLADYTTFPPAIAEELAKFGRNGVPVVLVYPKDASKSPVVLPDPLPYPAPYAPVVLNALKQAL